MQSATLCWLAGRACCHHEDPGAEYEQDRISTLEPEKDRISTLNMQSSMLQALAESL